MRDAIPGSLLRLSTSPAYVPFTGVIGFGLLVGARRGKDDRWPAPDAVPERRRDPIATCGWSIDIVAVVRTKRCKMVGGLREECDRGSAMADRLLEDGPGNHRPPPPPIVRRWTIGRCRGRMGTQNGGQRSGLWRHGAHVEMQAGSATGGCNRRLAPVYEKSTGPPPDLAKRLADISVIFLVSYRGRLKGPHLHCWSDAVV